MNSIVGARLPFLTGRAINTRVEWATLLVLMPLTAANSGSLKTASNTHFDLSSLRTKPEKIEAGGEEIVNKNLGRFISPSPRPSILLPSSICLCILLLSTEGYFQHHINRIHPPAQNISSKNLYRIDYLIINFLFNLGWVSFSSHPFNYIFKIFLLVSHATSHENTF